MSAAFAWIIWCPLAGACALLVLPRRWTGGIVAVTSVATLAAVATLAWLVSSSGPQRHVVGNWPPPLGILLYADGLSVIMLLITAAVGLAVTVYAFGYFDPPAGSSLSSGEGGPERERPVRPRWLAEEASDQGNRGRAGRPRSGSLPPPERSGSAGVSGTSQSAFSQWTPADGFWPMWLFLWTGLNGLFVAGDIFNLYVTLEILSLTAVALVIVGGGRSVLEAAMRYLLAAFLGALLYLLGVSFVYAAIDTVDMGLIAQRATASPVMLGALALMTVGLAVKAALFPLHGWLPTAHAGAPAPVSALLSGLVIKASFYLVARLWLQVLPGVVTLPAAQLIGALGAGAVIWGSIQAIRQSNLKLLIAHSTVAQVGYLFLTIPLVLSAAPGAISSSLGWDGGVLQVLAHASAKAAMFLAAGSFMRALGHDRFREFGGVAALLPMSTAAFGLASLSIMGLPPSGGFSAKWLMLSAALESGQWWWAAIFIVGGLLAAIYIFRAVSALLAPGSAADALAARPVGKRMEAPALALAVLSLGLGFGAPQVLDLLHLGSDRVWSNGAAP